MRITVIKAETNIACKIDICPAKDMGQFITDRNRRSNGITKVQAKAMMNSPKARTAQNAIQLGSRTCTITIKIVQKNRKIAGIWNSP
jgi:uncharacterized protein YfcZ (UPF0381/DUF406 family)